MSCQAARWVCVCRATISSFDCVPLCWLGMAAVGGEHPGVACVALLAASKVKELGLLVTHANTSRNSRHSKYGFEINSNVKITSSQFSVSDIRQSAFKHRSIAHRLLSCPGLYRLRLISVTAAVALRGERQSLSLWSASYFWLSLAMQHNAQPYCNGNRPLVYKKAVLSQRRPRDAPYI